MRWHEAAGPRGAASARKNGSIIVYDYEGNQMRRYSFSHAWPSKWEGPSRAIESVTIVAETIRRVDR